MICDVVGKSKRPYEMQDNTGKILPELSETETNILNYVVLKVSSNKLTSVTL